jgi:hypothetical protein
MWDTTYKQRNSVKGGFRERGEKERKEGERGRERERDGKRIN